MRHGGNHCCARPTSAMRTFLTNRLSASLVIGNLAMTFSPCSKSLNNGCNSSANCFTRYRDVSENKAYIGLSFDALSLRQTIARSPVVHSRAASTRQTRATTWPLPLSPRSQCRDRFETDVRHVCQPVLEIYVDVRILTQAEQHTVNDVTDETLMTYTFTCSADFQSDTTAVAAQSG